MMKRWFAISLACTLLLTGCGGTKSNTPPAPSPTPSTQESDALAAFRHEIMNNTIQIAAAYLGYAQLTGYEDLTVYLESCGFYELYPFLSEMTEDQFVQQEGGELYLVVPISADTVLTVSDCRVNETDFTVERGETLLTLKAGQPVLLQGNVSEITPNLLVTAETGGKKPLEYAPSLNMMDGSLNQHPGVYDCSDYDHLFSLWYEPDADIPVFCNTWYAQTMDGDGQARALMLTLWPDGSAEYSYGSPESDILESFEGSWHESDGVLTLDMSGGPVSNDGSDVSDSAYESVCTFEWDYQSRHLYLHHTGGSVLLYGTEGAAFDFLPFNSYLLAGTWSADAVYRDWTYDLSLLENGECRFSISQPGEEPALYEGWWFMSDDFYVNLDLHLSSGRHPENPEMEYISGTYLAERNGGTLDISFVSGGILTLNMEETTCQTFRLTSDSSCVSVHYAADLEISRDDCDWVIVDDTEPVEAVFCTMVPVENFAVVSLSLQDPGADGSDLHFDAAPLFDYGTLTPDRPLSVTLTIYGTIPSYGISFTDPNGADRLFGITVSGMDSSLQLTEIH